ncbi:MAG: dTDP-4-dehydrorhamnose reductase [Candidatus Omnitrophica bacterium]|nr:dTDP-4-dehydrorhamnose reductase [Candidatus Omnitrophota bacterium]
MDKKFLITGANGQLAKEFILRLKEEGADYLAPAKEQLDITDFEKVKKEIRRYKPDVLINCAAYNEVDLAEKYPQKAFSVNSEAVKNLAEVCRDHNIFLVHFSSDYVFDGQKKDLYTEGDQANPINIYGKSKWQGEEAIRARLTDFLIFRLSWLFGYGPRNFLNKVSQLTKENGSPAIVDDEISAPTYTADVVRAVFLALERGLRGTYHLTNDGKCSRYEWVKYYFRKINNPVDVAPMGHEKFISRAKRPQFSGMSNAKITGELGMKMPHWMDAVDRFVKNGPKAGVNTMTKPKKDMELINAAILGCGWFGSGLILELAHWPSIRPKVVFEQDVNRAVGALVSSGISKGRIMVAKSAADFSSGLKQNDRYIIADDLALISDLIDVDVVLDMTGNILAGTNAALMSIDRGIHFITASSELDSTIGPILHKKALGKGVIYSNSDGDQPGVLGRLITEVKSFGFSIEAAGNCKGFLDVHKTPDDIMPWVKPGQNPRMITAFTDGTKQGMELAVVANAFGLRPDVRGMHGLRTTKADLVRDFVKAISGSGIVDYCLGIDGIDQGGGVFVIGKKEGKRVQVDMNYLKKGDGPYYLFFRDHHLCYIEAPRSIIDVVVHNRPTIAPLGHYADVFAAAKRDLKAGEKPDGIGGYSVYGVIDSAKTVEDENLLPMGLTEYCRLKKNVSRDEPLTYAAVEFVEENVVVQLIMSRKNRVSF